MYSCVDCLLVILRFLCNNSFCSAHGYHCTVLNNNSVCVHSEERLSANPIYKNTTNTLLAKLDIKEAYRLIAVHPNDHILLHGVLWLSPM